MIPPISHRFNTITQPRRSDAPRQRPALPTGDSVTFTGGFGQGSGRYDSPINLDLFDDSDLPPMSTFMLDLPPAEPKPQEKIQSTIEKLNGVVVDNLFPLERQIKSKQFTSQKLGDYIARHPRFQQQLEKNPESLQRGLEQLAALVETLKHQPASQVLRDQNIYAHRHMVNHMLNYALQRILENPSQAEQTCTMLAYAMTRAQLNAFCDPSLKTEERILRHIEAQDHKLGLLQKTLNLIHKRQLSPDQFRPEANEHRLVQQARKHMKEFTNLPPGEHKDQALQDLEAKEAQLGALFRREQTRQQFVLEPVYSSLSEVLRGKVMRAFTDVPPEHPLKDLPGFPDLWQRLGGDSFLL